MPLGDSITSGFGSSPDWGYRGPLWNLLTKGGAAINFLGQYQDGPSSFPDPDHHGGLGQTADGVASQTGGLMAQYKPDIVLLMIGTNDIEYGDNPSNVRSEITQILGTIAAQRPATKVFVGTLPPLSTDRNGSWNIPIANQEIRAAVAEARAEGQRVKLVETNLTLSDLLDGVHPNQTGHTKIAKAWYKALIADDPGIGGRGGAISARETAVHGSEAGDRLYGSGSGNRLDGRGGNDLVQGRSGNDRIYGGSGNDRLYGGSGNDWVYGSSGNEAIFGESGGDTLSGSTGNDSITGGTGRDVLVGGSGDDRFVFRYRSESGSTVSTRDVITDFARGDRVDLSYLDANTTRSGNQKF